MFPSGINVNFAKLTPDNRILEYRCFERGIYRETLACGTGALAVSFVARKLNLVNETSLVIYPHRSRMENPDSELRITQDESGWKLNGSPMMLFNGVFDYQKPNRIIPFDKMQVDTDTSSKPGHKNPTAAAVNR
jgi:diaminopimelate epimerase